MSAGHCALDLDVLVALRRHVHSHPEVSNEESRTAGCIVDFLHECAEPDELIEPGARIFEGIIRRILGG